MQSYYHSSFFIHLSLMFLPIVCRLEIEKKDTSWVRSPLTTDRPQSEKSSVTACTVKRERFELTRHPAVTSTVTEDLWNKMDSVGDAYTHISHTLLHACMQTHPHILIWLTCALLFAHNQTQQPVLIRTALFYSVDAKSFVSSFCIPSFINSNTDKQDGSVLGPNKHLCLSQRVRSGAAGPII